MEEDPGIERGGDERARARAEQRAQMAAAAEADRNRRLNDPEKQHYFAAAGTALGVLGSGERLFVLLLFACVATVVVPAGLDSLFHWSARASLVERQDPVVFYLSRIWPLFPCYLLLGMAMLVMGRVAAGRAAGRERAWMKSLPFPVDGYLDAFGRGTWHQTLKVTVAFAGGAMPKAELAGLLDVFSPGAPIKDWSDELEFKVMHAGRLGILSGLFARSGNRSSLPGLEYTSNRALLLLFHDVTREVLLPLHRAHPIATVKLDS